MWNFLNKQQNHRFVVASLWFWLIFLLLRVKEEAKDDLQKVQKVKKLVLLVKLVETVEDMLMVPKMRFTRYSDLRVIKLLIKNLNNLF